MTNVGRALIRLLETPRLVAAVQRLPAAALSQALDAVGLEDGAELLALATSEQLAGLIDHDLWSPGSRAFDADRFDADRFGVWLEVLVELGPAQAAAKLAMLDEDFLTFAFGERLVVLDVEELATLERDVDSDEARAADKRLESGLCHELGRYTLVAKHHDGWDATLAVLTALDEHDSDLCERMLSRLWAASAEQIADDGLSSLLSLSDQLESDAAFAREQRLEKEGFVTAQNAQLMLELAWLSSPADAATVDPITQSYLRRVAPTVRPPDSDEPDPLDTFIAAATVAAPARLAGEVEERLPIVAALAASDPDATMLRLGYLVNVLLSGVTFQGRRLRPTEAADAVLAYANAGYQQQGCPAPVDLLAAFRLGWTRVQELALAVARRVDHPRVRGAADRHKARAARAVTADATVRLLVGECPALPGAWFGRAAPLFPATEAHFARAAAYLRTSIG